MSIVITGNPGVGKHTITHEIAERLKLYVVDINTIAKDSGLFEKNDNTNDVDVKELEKILKEIEQISKESLTVFENSITALSKRNYEVAEKVATSVTKVIEKEKKLMDSLKPNDNTAIIKLILEDIRRTAEYSRDISEIAIDETVQSVIEES